MAGRVIKRVIVTGAVTLGLLVGVNGPSGAQIQRASVSFAIGGSAGSAGRDSLPVHSLTPRDTFLGPDKVKHFLLSAFIESVGFSGMQVIGANRSTSLAAATAVTAAAGLTRELHDRRTKGLFSLGDLTWDALGAGAALLVIQHSER